MTRPAPIPFPKVKTPAGSATPANKAASRAPVTPSRALKGVSRLPLTVPGGHHGLPSGAD